MAKNSATVVGRPTAIPEGDGGRDLMIQPVYITWTEKDGKLGLMRQWANVRIIEDKAFVNPRVDIELLRPIEWTMKEIDEIRNGQAVDEKEGEAEEKEPEVRPSSPKRPREDKEEDERRTSPRRSREASPSSVEGRIDQNEPPRDPRPGTSRDDCRCPRCEGHTQWWLGVTGQRRRKEPENRKTRSGRPVPATYEECPDNSPVEYAERDPYEGLVEGEDYPSMSLQSGYEEELWRQEEEWARKNRWRIFGEDEEAGES